LVGNTKADVLPDEGELLGNVLQRWVVGRIICEFPASVRAAR
jgi:hypothetical protein